MTLEAERTRPSIHVSRMPSYRYRDVYDKHNELSNRIACYSCGPWIFADPARVQKVTRMSGPSLLFFSYTLLFMQFCPSAKTCAMLIYCDTDSNYWCIMTRRTYNSDFFQKKCAECWLSDDSRLWWARATGHGQCRSRPVVAALYVFRYVFSMQMRPFFLIYAA